MKFQVTNKPSQATSRIIDSLPKDTVLALIAIGNASPVAKASGKETR